MIRILLSFIFFFGINFCFGQNESVKSDFLEIGFRGSSFSKSRFLESAAFHDLMGNPEEDFEGLLPTGLGSEFGGSIKYGERFSKKLHLLFEISYSHRTENVTCWCHLCDKISIELDPLKIHSIESGIGARYSFFQKGKLNFSGEALGFYSFSFNQPDIRYFSVYFSPILGYDITKSVQLNLKLIFEKPILKYNKNELPIEIAVLKKI